MKKNKNYEICIMSTYLCYKMFAVGITHGDLKPENIFLNFKNKEIPEIKMAIRWRNDSDLEKLKDYFKMIIVI